MTITLNEILNIKSVLLKIIQYSFPYMETNKNIIDFYKEISGNWEFYYTERYKLFKKYGIEDIETGNIEIKKENIENFNKDINELLNIEIDVKHQLNLMENDIYHAVFCGDDKTKQLTPQDIIILLDFINSKDKSKLD